MESKCIAKSIRSRVRRYNCQIFTKGCNPQVLQIWRNLRPKVLVSMQDQLDVHKEEASITQLMYLMKTFIQICQNQRAWAKFLLIRFQPLKADMLNQRKGLHFSIQLVVWLSLLAQEVLLDLRMKLDIPLLRSISISSKPIIEVVAVLHNNLLKEILVWDFQAQDLFRLKTYHLISVKMNGVKSRSLAKNCTRKRLEKKKRTQKRKLEMWEKSLTSKWLFARNCKPKQNKREKTLIAKL